MAATDIEIHAREILKVKGRMNELMALHTGQSLEQIERDTERDRFLSAPEAVEYGLVDSILTHRSDARGATVPLYLSGRHNAVSGLRLRMAFASSCAAQRTKKRF